MLKKLLLTILGLLSLTGAAVGVHKFGGIEPVKPYASIDWQRPTTDDAWATDVKQESFDIKTEAELLQMKDDLTTRLPDYVHDFEQFSDPEFSGVCLWEKEKRGYDQDTATQICAEDKTRIAGEIDKMSQSVERIDKELELRKSGYLTVKTKKQATKDDYSNPTVRILNP